MLGFAQFLITILSSPDNKLSNILSLSQDSIESQLHKLLEKKEYYQDYQVWVDTKQDVCAYSLVKIAYYYAHILKTQLKSSHQAVVFDTKDHFNFVLTLIALSFLNKDIILKPYIDTNNLDLHTAYLNSATLSKTIEDAITSYHQDDNLDNQALIIDAISSKSKIIVFTSGSTGMPKRIIKTFDIMLKEVVLFDLKVKVDINSVLLSTVSPFHLYGLSFSVFLPLCLKIAIVNSRIEVPEDMNSYQGKSCILISSPAFLSRIDNKLAAPNFSLVLSAGGVLTLPVAEHFYNWAHSAIREIYGSSETGIIATRTQGKSSSNFEPFDNMVFSQDESLKVSLKSPLIYEKELLLDDELEFNSDNSFIIKGRYDRMIKIGDKRFNLVALENTLKEHPKVLDAYVLSVDISPLSMIAPVKRERIGALIALAHPELCEDIQYKKALIQELKELMKSKYEPLAIPRFWRFCQAIPVNSMGKILKPKIKQYFKISS